MTTRVLLTERTVHREILTIARSYVARGWTQGARARDASGQSVDPLDPTAVCWCVLGAITAAAMQYLSCEVMDPRVDDVIRAFKVAVGFDLLIPLARYNDAESMTQEQILVGLSSTILELR